MADDWKECCVERVFDGKGGKTAVRITMTAELARRLQALASIEPGLEEFDVTLSVVLDGKADIATIEPKHL